MYFKKTQNKVVDKHRVDTTHFSFAKISQRFSEFKCFPKLIVSQCHVQLCPCTALYLTVVSVEPGCWVLKKIGLRDIFSADGSYICVVPWFAPVLHILSIFCP